MYINKYGVFDDLDDPIHLWTFYEEYEEYDDYYYDYSDDYFID